MNPYILMPQNMQDVSGLQPVFQNFGQQQANQQAALAQQNQLVNQAGQTQGGGGINPMALAEMLRKENPDLSKEQNKEIRKLGSNPNNPLSGYNTGMFGWGNYGE
jgi:hypothetical protein